MDHQPLTTVLALLRAIKDKKQVGLAYLQSMAVTDKSERTILQLALGINEQIALASAVINSSGLSDEAKQGVQNVLSQLSKNFSVSGIQGSVNLGIDVTAAISNFVILLSAAGIQEMQAAPSEAIDLIKEIADFQANLKDPAIDPAVKDIAQRHLAVLETFLRHIPIFGLEPALTTYFEMIIKLRRAEINTSDEAKKSTEPLWDNMKTWGDRLMSLDKLWNAGAKVLMHADKAQHILAHIPHLPI